LRCSQDAPKGAMHFGQSAQGEQNEYAELLFTVTDSPMLLRDGEYLETTSFVDELSKTVRILSVSYTPISGIITSLEISADFSGARVHVDHSFSQVQAIEGFALSQYYGWATIAMVCCVVMSVEIIYYWVLFKASWHIEAVKWIWKGAVCNGVLSVIVCVFTMVHMASASQSVDRMTKVMSELVSLPWSADLPINDKMQQFFASMDNLQTWVLQERWFDLVSQLIMMMISARLILATSFHPRVALLVDVLERSLENLWHVLLVYLLICFVYACIGCVSFGKTRAEFGSLPKALEMQLYVTMGEIPEDTMTDTMLGLYVLVLVCVCFLLMMNFVLSIVVEGFMSVTDSLRQQTTEQSLIQDSLTLACGTFNRFYWGWPKPHLMIHHLESIYGKRDVTFADLPPEIFPSGRSRFMYVRYFRKMACLHAKPRPKLKDVPGLLEEVQKAKARECVRAVQVAKII